MPRIPATELSRAVERVFIARGVPPADARVVADHLVDAEACGVASHGIMRVAQYAEALESGRVRPNAALTVTKEAGAAARLDGGNGLGPVMAARAVDFACQRARREGCAAVTLVNVGHTGRLGHYTERGARSGCAMMMAVNAGGAGQWVAPHGAVGGRLSTNPISLAVPQGSRDPLVLDMATSTVPEGRVRAALLAGQAIPEGWVVAANGSPARDPADLYGPPRGAILPFGGHKGYGLAVMVELLAGGLSGAGVCSSTEAPDAGASDGVFLFAAAVEAFIDPACLAELAAQLTSHLKGAPRAPGAPEVLVPGEREFARRREALQTGLFINEADWQRLEDLAGHGAGPGAAFHHFL